MNERPVNLIDEVAVTTRLLAEPLAWRARAVEEVCIDAATSCVRRRSLQAAPLRPILKEFIPEGIGCARALVAINVAPVRRGPLLELDIEGPYGRGFLLPRLAIAERQADFLASLLAEDGIAIGDEARVVLALILGFVGTADLESGETGAIEAYVEDGLGYSPSRRAEWVDLNKRAESVLRPHLDLFRGYSAPESPALVIPTLVSERRAEDEAAATAMVRSYVELLEGVDARLDQGGAVVDFMRSLADYGNFFDMIVAVEVPLDEPFVIKFSERRSFSMSWRNESSQELTVADAITNHVTFKVEDSSARITRFRAKSVGNDATAFGSFLAREDPQIKSFYAYGDDREYRVRLIFALALLRRLMIVPYLVALVVALTTAALWIERPHQLGELGPTVGLAALAATVLHAREPSTLGSRLRVRSTLFVAGTVAALLLSAALLYAFGLGRGEVDPPCRSAQVHSPQTGDCDGEEHG